MKIILVFLLITAASARECSRNKKEIPSCVQQRIEEIKKEPKWNPPAEVNEYIYKGQPVFLFTSNCCDRYIMLYDGNCSFICAPGGGFTGKGDGKCIDFYKTASRVRLVWKDER